jgi:hypothetical protein
MFRRAYVRGIGIAFAVFACLAPAAGQTGKWWMDEPFRLVQTNLRETDASLDAKHLVQQLVDFPANVYLTGMGGIVAYYPSKVEFHYPSTYMPAGRDMFGEVLKEAHAHGIRVIGRFDLSKAQKGAYDAHPEWFFRKANGEPVIYNGLYSTCINGDYYHVQLMKILTEALENYDVDGVFFNMFGNQATDYSGNPVGLCHCDVCKRKFQERFGRSLPDRPDADYQRFLADASAEATRNVTNLIHSKRPNAGIFARGVDTFQSESNTALDRPLPLWPYASSDNVNYGRNSEPGKMAVDLSIGFVAISNRFVTEPGNELQIRAYENMANGGGATFVALGTLDQEDMSGINAVRPVFKWHAEHQDLYVGQESAARVLLLASNNRMAGAGNYRGLFRILSEQHVPFAVSGNPARIRDRNWDLVIAPDGAPAELEAYVRGGGRALIAGTSEPGSPWGKSVRRWTDTVSSYFRVQDHTMFPSLKDTQLLFLSGDYLEMEPVEKPLLTLIPPSRFGPAEKTWGDKVETTKPGLLLTDYGQGKAAYVPWNVGALYYRNSSPGHAGLVTDLIDYLLPNGRQLKTNAHPLVETVLMNQPKRSRTIVHLINLTGHSDTGYFPPVEMRGITVEVEGKFQRARSAKSNASLPVSVDGKYTKVTLPQLEAYDAVVFE